MLGIAGRRIAVTGAGLAPGREGDGMSGIELVCALLSFVYALALTHVLQSASELWVARDRLKISLSLIAWMALAVLMLVNNWLALIPLARSEWSPVAVLVSFATAVTQYFTCSIASIKVPEDGPIDMRAYEDRHGVGYKVAYLALTAIVLLANAVQFEEWAGRAFDWWILLEASWTMLAFGAAILASIWWRARWFQIAVPVAYCVFLIWIMMVPY